MSSLSQEHRLLIIKALSRKKWAIAFNLHHWYKDMPGPSNRPFIFCGLSGDIEHGLQKKENFAPSVTKDVS